MNQVTNTLLLVRPSRFGYNRETAATNTFQNLQHSVDIGNVALSEFEKVLQILLKEDIESIVANDNPVASTPDSVFPNNWVSFHEENKVVLYPMLAPNRRRERSNDIVELVATKQGLSDVTYLDLTGFEKEGKFLEGTGSVVFDHRNRTAYAALSPRTHVAPFEKLVSGLNYSGFTFETKDPAGTPIYHTNVLMSIGNDFAVVCDEVVINQVTRKLLLEKLEQSGHRLILINPDQMAAFAGNVLQISNRKEEPFLLLSETARKAFSVSQLKILEQYSTLLPVPVPVIEKTGGGSIRCMVAEVFLKPEKNFRS